MSEYRFGVEKSRSPHSIDQALLASIILLAGIGLVALFSASSGFALRFFNDSTYFLRKQALVGLLGAVLFFLGAWINLDSLRNWIKPLVFGSFCLCLLTFFPVVGLTKNGASRWIDLGFFTYQPSELAKLVLPIYLAHIFAKKEERLESIASGVLPPTIVTVAFFFVVYLQNDFSTAFFLALNAVAIFFFAGVRLRHFLILIGVSAPVALGLMFAKDYRIDRIRTFFHPEADPLGAGYQVKASIDTVISGGFWGKGLGQGTRKIASVPEVHSDFVFAAFSEEMGFIGVVALFFLFGFFAFRGYRSSLRNVDPFRRFMGFGLVTGLVSQALLNVAVVAGAVPATGVPLPFFSAGGSSLATTLFICGLIINISKMDTEARPRDV